MDRDFIGYGQNPPCFNWPNQARLAINFVINVEEGSENSPLYGDPDAESLFCDIPGIITRQGQRHLSSESMFEYGSRVGIWRLLKLFDEYSIPTTLFATGMALQQNPPLADYLRQAAQHEVAGHGLRWIDYADMPPKQELEHIHSTIQIIESEIRRPLLGWYTGRCSNNTRGLLQHTEVIYDSQSYADDLPFWDNRSGLLIILYNLDCNDIRYCTQPGWSSADDCFLYLKHAFDCLYREAQQSPRLMTVGLHPRLAGRPARAEAIRRFIDYSYHKQVWLCRRQDIAKFWGQQFPIPTKR